MKERSVTGDILANRSEIEKKSGVSLRSISQILSYAEILHFNEDEIDVLKLLLEHYVNQCINESNQVVFVSNTSFYQIKSKVPPSTKVCVYENRTHINDVELLDAYIRLLKAYNAYVSEAITYPHRSRHVPHGGTR